MEKQLSLTLLEKRKLLKKKLVELLKALVLMKLFIKAKKLLSLILRDIKLSKK